jgi:hypothetical protein
MSVITKMSISPLIKQINKIQKDGPTETAQLEFINMYATWAEYLEEQRAYALTALRSIKRIHRSTQEFLFPDDPNMVVGSYGSERPELYIAKVHDWITWKFGRHLFVDEDTQNETDYIKLLCFQISNFRANIYKQSSWIRRNIIGFVTYQHYQDYLQSSECETLINMWRIAKEVASKVKNLS